MMRRLLRSDRGMGAVEFGFVAPVICAFIVGVAQLGMLFFANAGLQSAVAEGARLATIYPRPTNQQIIARITDTRFGLDPAYITAPTVRDFQVNGRNYKEISMSYQVPLDFIFFQTSPLTLVGNRRVYVHAS
ncbi:MAG: pilus assembly protein [Pseudomonadota bacterium]|nr:pilus assembly protein [Pseudomonadota bacterium]